MININFAKTEHVDLISEFEQNYFNTEAYSKDTIIDILKDNYILINNINLFVVTNQYDELIGYIIFTITNDYTDILKVFIRDNDRRNGYATLLINKIIELALRFKSKKIMIEVRSKNISAIDFYKHNGFNEISIRKNYYTNPSDDALIFERNIL